MGPKRTIFGKIFASVNLLIKWFSRSCFCCIPLPFLMKFLFRPMRGLVVVGVCDGSKRPLTIVWCSSDTLGSYVKGVRLNPTISDNRLFSLFFCFKYLVCYRERNGQPFLNNQFRSENYSWWFTVTMFCIHRLKKSQRSSQLYLHLYLHNFRKHETTPF